MKKNLENITEELIMRYVEGDLNLDEYEQFTKIMSQNEYLSSRVDALKIILKNEPKIVPSQQVHNKILNDLRIDKPSSYVATKNYINTVVSFFENRPFALGTAVSGFVVAFVLFLNLDNKIVHDNSIEISEDVEELNQEEYDSIIDDDFLQ